MTIPHGLSQACTSLPPAQCLGSSCRVMSNASSSTCSTLTERQFGLSRVVTSRSSEGGSEISGLQTLSGWAPMAGSRMSQVTGSPRPRETGSTAARAALPLSAWTGVEPLPSLSASTAGLSLSGDHAQALRRLAIDNGHCLVNHHAAAISGVAPPRTGTPWFCFCSQVAQVDSTLQLA